MFLWCHPTTRPTGKKLAAALGIPARSRDIPRNRGQVLVRWGNAAMPQMETLIQQPAAIVKACNKLVTLQTLKAADVSVPEFSTNVAVLDREDAVWFGRDAHGMCGRDIEIIQPGAICGRHRDFFTKYIPTKIEYRIHVFGDQVLGVMGKYLDFPEQAGDNMIRNHGHGYRYRTPNVQLHAQRTEAAVAAVRALGLDFGAVDLLIGQDGHHYILEVNTAPGLAPLTFAKYVEAIKRTARERGANVPA